MPKRSSSRLHLFASAVYWAPRFGCGSAAPSLCVKRLLNSCGAGPPLASVFRMRHLPLALLAFASALFVAAAGAQPAVTPDLAVMNLDELGVYAVGYAYRGQPEQQFPLGWSGFFEDRTGVACEPFGTQNGERAFLLHCPWRNGTGITFQQFVFSLPAQATRILLQGATAMRSAKRHQLRRRHLPPLRQRHQAVRLSPDQRRLAVVPVLTSLLCAGRT